MATNKNNLKVFYDREADALLLALRRGRETDYDEIAPGVGIERDASGNILGFEILNASRSLKKALPEMIQELRRRTAAV